MSSGARSMTSITGPVISRACQPVGGGGSLAVSGSADPAVRAAISSASAPSEIRRNANASASLLASSSHCTSSTATRTGPRDAQARSAASTAKPTARAAGGCGPAASQRQRHLQRLQLRRRDAGGHLPEHAGHHVGQPREGQRATPFAGARAPALYSPAGRAELAAVAAAQRDPAKRSSALALVVFGIGAGLRPGELVALRGSDVTRHGRQVFVQVSGPSARVVPVTAGYAGRAWQLAQSAGSDFVFRPGPAGRSYKNFVTNFARGLAADPAAPALSLRRARSTFICGHLAAGTPVGVLLAVTGIAEAGSLARYARHVAGVSSSKGVLRERWRAEHTR